MMIEIQDMQVRLDALKSEKASIVTEIRSLSQRIPQLIRDLPIK